MQNIDVNETTISEDLHKEMVLQALAFKQNYQRLFGDLDINLLKAEHDRFNRTFRSDNLKGMVVQFNESHKWCGALGIVSEVHAWSGLTVGVTLPEKGIAYIRCDLADVEIIGNAVLIVDESLEPGEN